MSNTRLLTFPDTGVYTGGDRDRMDYIPNPSDYAVSQHDQDLNSQRTTSGYLIRNRVRKGSWVVAVTWKKLNDKQLDTLLSACDKEKFKLTFRAPTVVGRYATAEMYVDADREMTLTSVESDKLDYWEVSLSFIEY